MDGAEGPRAPEDGEVYECLGAYVRPAVKFGSAVVRAVGDLFWVCG